MSWHINNQDKLTYGDADHDAGVVEWMDLSCEYLTFTVTWWYSM